MRRLGILARIAGPALALVAIFVLVLLAPPSMRLPVLGVAAFLIVATACVLLLPSRLVARDTTLAELKPEQRASAVNSARTTLVQGLVGLAALTGIFVAWQQLQIDREQSRTDRQQLREQLTLTRQGQVAERFTRAVDQLGSAKLEQRLGGIYGLERIAKESPDNDTRLVVIELVTNYVRQHASIGRGGTGDASSWTQLGDRAPDVQAAMTVLGRRTVMPTDPPLNLIYVDLRGADLPGARLQRAILFGARLQNARLWDANLEGANLHSAELQQAGLLRARMRGASLGSAHAQQANLANAQLQGADLSGTNLQGADLASAKLQGADLRGAQLQEAFLIDIQLQDADLARAQLQGANFRGAQLQKAQLSETRLAGADLTGAQLREASCDAKTGWPRGFDWKAAGVVMG